MANAERELLDFLDRKAFDPVLRANPGKYSGNDRRKLEDVQRATRAEQERYRNYGSARKIVEMFKGDLNSEPAQKIHRELKALGLPTLNDLRGEFEKLAQDLGVEAGAHS